MHHLIEGSLHKGRVDVTEYPQSLCSKSCTKCYGMLLADAHIKCTVRHFLHHKLQGTTTWHSRSNAKYFVVHFCQLYHGMSKNILISWCLRCRRSLLQYLSCYLIKQTRCMPLGLIFFCQRKALSFYRYYMQQLRTRYFL